MVVQPCECSKCHGIVHFRMIDGLICCVNFTAVFKVNYGDGSWRVGVLRGCRPAGHQVAHLRPAHTLHSMCVAPQFHSLTKKNSTPHRYVLITKETNGNFTREKCHLNQCFTFLGRL